MNQFYRDQRGMPAAKKWAIALAVWLLALYLLPDPRPLSAPTWGIELAKSLFALSESKARLFTAVVFRAIGLAMIGIFLSMALIEVPVRRSAIYVLAATPVLAIVVKWMNFGYFPIRMQLVFIIIASLFGALAGLALRKSRAAAVTGVVLVPVVLAWGMGKKVPVDLDMAARATGLHLLDNSDQIASGDEAFGQVVEMAFAFAEDNSHGTDAVFANKAAILALGVIVGDEKVAKVGWSDLGPALQQQRAALRQRVTAHGRNDLPRHFAVSAALTLLTDEHRALAVGITKELSDSQPGGSGFSFVDMVANKAGIRFAVVATKSQDSARKMQMRIIGADPPATLIPPIDGFAEGLSSGVFEGGYGGVGGLITRELFKEIDQRVLACEALRPDSP
jgi:hypothetical protein